MTRNLIHFALIAGAMAITGTTAFAQTHNMKANIPFAFQVSGKTLPAGEYEINKLAGEANGWAMRHSPTKAAAMMVSGYTAKARPESQRNKGMLVFQCAGATCAIQSLYAPGAAGGYAFNNKLRHVDPTIQVATIRVVYAD